MLDKSSKIFVAGHSGLVGSAIVRCLKSKNYNNISLRTHSELDLTDQFATREFFLEEKPDIVFLAAAKVGGIHANSSFPVEFIRDNLAIQNNVINEAFRIGVKDLVFLGSSCIYPRDCSQPITEDQLMTGPLEPTNRPYSIAKISGIELCWSYNKEFDTRYVAVMPTNLYGPGDSYDLNTSHVLPALLRKCHELKMNSQNMMTVWGSGQVFREFLYSDDLAEACVYLMTQPKDRLNFLFGTDGPPLINVGSGAEHRIRDLVTLISEVVEYRVELNWDRTKPDGAPRKLLDSSKIRGLGWTPLIDLKDGLQRVYGDYLERYSCEG